MSLPMIPAIYQTPAAVFFVIGGLLSCVAGYRYFRLVLVLNGLVLGALIATSVVGAGSTAQIVGAAIAGGLVGAFILYWAYFVGVALVGAAIGAFLAHAIWAELGREPQALAVILFAVAGAAAAMVLQRYVIITATAYGGAWTAMIGTLALLEGGRALKAASAGDVWVVYPFSTRTEDRWMLIVWVALGTFGMLTQLGMTGRAKSHGRK
jgi:Domain of unknown function (DUF4203)